MIKLSSLHINPDNPRIIKDDKFICSHCGKKFTSRKADKNRIPKYCSRNCSNTRTITEVTRGKMSDAKIGATPWNKGVEMWKDKKHPRGTLGMIGLGKGRKRSEQTIELLRESHIGLKYPAFSKENHWNWKGGITNPNEAIRKSAEYKNWRRSVFNRDGFKCTECGIKGGYLHADHIKPFALFAELRFDVNNGRTLCKSCHEKTETYGGKMLKYAV